MRRAGAARAVHWALLVVLAALSTALGGCGGCRHDAANCALGNEDDCADLGKFGGCIKEANCCESSDASSEISSLTSWRKRLNELYASAELAGLACEPSPCVS
ncbi:unnamed protein product [Symbiodinium natans]|uniref:Uncharacterized protein n=1 Tax=Symbiodinium natans TaxID=878477 RepID=A0A812I560_9DINO|nr:unnamed protein product [Symbiodinium natans]